MSAKRHLSRIQPPFPVFEATSDALRGGKSSCHVSHTPSTVRLNGHLDPSVLGAGFAGAFSTGKLDFSAAKDAVGVYIAVKDYDSPYPLTMVLKEDALVGDRPKKGKRESTVSWETKFTVDMEKSSTVTFKWSQFKKTYRGREIEGEKLDPTKIKRWGVLGRSYFGAQSGDFTVTFSEFGLVKQADSLDIKREEALHMVDEKVRPDAAQKTGKGWMCTIL